MTEAHRKRSAVFDWEVGRVYRQFALRFGKIRRMQKNWPLRVIQGWLTEGSLGLLS